MEGAHRLDEDETLSHLATAPSPKFLGLFRGLVYDYELLDRSTLERDLARLERFYRARGYYEAHARVARVERTSPDHVRVTLVVEEGAPVLVRAVRIDGVSRLPAALRETLAARARAECPPGRPFDEDELGLAVEAVTRTLADAGYGRATVVRDVTVDVVTRRADVVLGVTAGEPQVFGPIVVEGLGSVPEAPVRRALDLAPGEPYSQTALESAERAVQDLGVFASVKVRAAPDGPGSKPGVVPVVVTVEPAKLRSVRLGVGTELDAVKTDVHGIVGWEDHDFFGGLRTYSVTLRPGVVLYPLRVDDWRAPKRFLPELRVQNEFRQPGFVEARTNLVIRPALAIFPVLLPSVPRSLDSIPGYLELAASASVERSFGRLYASLGENVQVERPFAYRGASDPGLRTVVLSFPELITNLDLTDDRVRPRRGIFLGNSLQVAGGPFGGDATDVRLRPDVRGYVPLGRRVTFAVRGAFGFLFPRNYGSSLDDDARAQRSDDASRIRDLQVVFFRGFFAGGPNSNRGYPLRSIGPYQVVASPAFGGSASIAACTASAADEESCRIPVGGRTLVEASAEFRFAVTGPLSVATFCDAADVSSGRVDIRPSHPHLSCGAGGRYDTPVGPVRLDIGYRIPGLQVIGGPDPTEREPDPLFGLLPVGIAFGIGEAF